MPDVGPGHGEHGGGEPGLHDRLLVGVVEDQQLVRDLADRRGGVGRDPDLAGPAAQVPQRVENLGGGARAGHRQHRVVVAGRQLGRGEGVGLPVPGRLPGGRDRARYMPGGAAADDRDPLTARGQDHRSLAGGPQRSRPAVRLTCDLPLHVRLRCLHPVGPSAIQVLTARRGRPAPNTSANAHMLPINNAHYGPFSPTLRHV
jgi:hypothetical protein